MNVQDLFDIQCILPFHNHIRNRNNGLLMVWKVRLNIRFEQIDVENRVQLQLGSRKLWPIGIRANSIEYFEQPKFVIVELVGRSSSFDIMMRQHDKVTQSESWNRQAMHIILAFSSILS